MAVAFSGQSVIWEANDFTEVLTAFNALPNPESYLIMGGHRSFPMSKAPFNALYEVWGTMFLHSIAESQNMHSGYTTDDGPYLSPAELKRAVAIVKDTPALGSEHALQLHANKKSLTISNIKNEICSFIG